MANNLNKEFLELEKLNIQLDIWIDDENYAKVENGIVTNAKDNPEGLFDKNIFCTEPKKDEENKWQALLFDDRVAVPTIQASPIDKDWSHLFYAKFLRAKILQRGDSDCYIRRLDDVATYLESHIPKPKDEGDTTKLLLMYLMELSAISMRSESLGYSERARRIITDAKHRITLAYEGNGKESGEAAQKAPYEFYELWSRYNIGVAYFHQREYRKSVLEFNQIIWQVKKWKEYSENGGKKQKYEAKECLKFFGDDKGRELLLLPAILYRAEVQLKLQMAYHTLDTLNKHEKENGSDNELHGWGSEHRRVTSDIKKAEAYQQLGRLDKSWGTLNDIYSVFVKKKNGLGKRIEGIYLKDQKRLKYPGLRERFFDHLIENHLQWLCLDGEDENERSPEISYLIKKDPDKVTEDEYNKASDVKPYLEKLDGVFKKYWELVEHHADNRSGYFQQVAKYLGWLAKTTDFKDSPQTIESRKMFADIAIGLYENNRDGILMEEPGMGDRDVHLLPPPCLNCSKGIDLRRIEDEHYKWFTDDMMEFFDSKSIKNMHNNNQLKENKNKFVKRLIRLERKARGNLRINDLKLHYDFYKPKELLRNSVYWWKMRKGRDLCLGKTSLDHFAGLLACAPKNEDGTYYDYEKLMKDWDDDFLHHLKSPSIHKYDTKENQYYFVGLQRWNSSSPAKGYSVGGGYLIYHIGKDKQVDLGIAIDPGFDFVRNLFHSGFSLDDIDIVLISHAHVDHIRDFESIITLMYELKRKSKRERRVHVILSLGTYERLKHIIESPGLRYFIEPYIIDIDREIEEDYFEQLVHGKRVINFKFERIEANKQEPDRQIERFRAILPEMKGDNNHVVKISPTRAYHDDHTNYSDSFGFLIELKEDDSEGEKITFGYTGDTKWIYPNILDPLKQNSKSSFEDVAKQYKDYDVLVVHLGSLIKRNDGNGEYSFSKYNQCNSCDSYNCEDLVCTENHPYLVGMLRLLTSLSSNEHNNDQGKPLIMISEFGEELKGNIRTDFVWRLQQTYENKLSFLPVDVGMNVQLCRKDSNLNEERENKCTCKVFCVQCQKFVNINDAGFEMFGNDNALYCVCRTCKNATPNDVLQTKLRKLYEVGYDINTRTDDVNEHS